MKRTTCVAVAVVALLAFGFGAGAFAAEYLTGIQWAEPAVIDPGAPGGAPSDATVLFDGTDMSQWEGADQWTVADGAVTAGPPTWTVGSVAVSEFVIKYVARLVRATRPQDETAPEFVRELVDWGAGPRASQYLILGAKAVALLDGRLTPSVDDVHAMAVPVLRHRIVTNFNAEADGVSAVEIVNRLLSFA